MAKPICHNCKSAVAGRFTDDQGWHLCSDCARELRQKGGELHDNVTGVGEDGRSPKGAEPWEWRPFREMLDNDGNIVIDQPPPPVHVARATPKATTSKGLPLDRVDTSQLTTDQRRALELQLQGHDYESIGAELGISVTTVRERLRRARAALRRGA